MGRPFFCSAETGYSNLAYDLAWGSLPDLLSTPPPGNLAGPYAVALLEIGSF